MITLKLQPRSSGKTTWARNYADDVANAMYINCWATKDLEKFKAFINHPLKEQWTFILDEFTTLPTNILSLALSHEKVHNFILLGTPIKPLEAALPPDLYNYLVTNYPEYFI